MRRILHINENNYPFTVRDFAERKISLFILASDTVENGGYGEENVIRYKAATDTVQALKTGKVDAVIIDEAPARSFVKTTEGLKILDGTWLEENYAIAIAKDNTELLNKVNTALKELIADGTVKSIIDKYIPAE